MSPLASSASLLSPFRKGFDSVGKHQGTLCSSREGRGRGRSRTPAVGLEWCAEECVIAKQAERQAKAWPVTTGYPLPPEPPASSALCDVPSRFMEKMHTELL